jgi:hypothetical protein
MAGKIFILFLFFGWKWAERLDGMGGEKERRWGRKDCTAKVRKRQMQKNMK